MAFKVWLWTLSDKDGPARPFPEELPKDVMLENSGHLLTCLLWVRLSAFIYLLENHLEDAHVEMGKAIIQEFIDKNAERMYHKSRTSIDGNPEM